ncbi:Mor transcription activator family protein [Yersinia pseudotuberculosis]
MTVTARQFNISEQSVYRIVKQQRKEVANRIQGDLFTGIAASDEEEA